MEQKTFIQRAGDFVFYCLVALLALLAGSTLVTFTLFMVYMSLQIVQGIHNFMGYY